MVLVVFYHVFNFKGQKYFREFHKNWEYFLKKCGYVEAILPMSTLSHSNMSYFLNSEHVHNVKILAHALPSSYIYKLGLLTALLFMFSTC